MRRLSFGYSFAVLLALWGCGGGGGGTPPNPTPVADAQFQIAWPKRTRADLTAPSSALSASVVLKGAGAGGADVAVKVDRDAARIEAHTETYTVSQAIEPNRVGRLAATFYAEAGQRGAVVATATATATLQGTSLRFATIALDRTITGLTAFPATLTVGGPPVELAFSPTDAEGNAVAVSPGSARWTVASGAEFVTVRPDGLATPVAAGSARVRVTVDGVTSAPVAVSVQTVTATEVVYRWEGEKGGNPTSPSFSAVEGDKFMVGGANELIVTELGHEFYSETQPKSKVGLFDSTGTLIASVEVGPGDTLRDGYYYREIEPVTLISGQEYYIGALHGIGDEWTYLHDTNPAIVPPSIIDLGTFFKVTDTLEGGFWSDGGGVRHYVANLTFRPAF